MLHYIKTKTNCHSNTIKITNYQRFLNQVNSMVDKYDGYNIQ